MHVYEVPPRKDHRGVDLISDALVPRSAMVRRGKRTRFRDQKITAPHTDGVKGGCSPQNTIVLNQRPAHYNQATR